MENEDKKTTLKILLISESILLLAMICNMLMILFEGNFPMSSGTQNLFLTSLIIFVVTAVAMIIEYIVLRKIRVK